MTLDEMKFNLVRAARRFHEAGMVLPGEGNLSMRLPGEDAMVITPTGNRYDDLEPEDLAVVGFDGTPDERRSGPRAASSEYRIHAALYRQRPAVGAVAHAHPPEAAAHAVLGEPIPLIMEEVAAILGGPVPCAPFRRTGTGDLVSAMLGVLGRGNAVLLANHGPVTCGRSLADAVDTMMVVEKLAGIHRRARSLADGDPLPDIPAADAEVLTAIFRERYSTA